MRAIFPLVMKFFGKKGMELLMEFLSSEPHRAHSPIGMARPRNQTGQISRNVLGRWRFWRDALNSGQKFRETKLIGNDPHTFSPRTLSASFGGGHVQ